MKGKLIVLELNEDIFEISKEVVEEYHLLPNDALIAATCKYHRIKKSPSRSYLYTHPILLEEEEMAEVVVKIPKGFESEVKSWGVELQPLFLAFLKREFDKIKRFELLVKESKEKDEFELKKLADEMDEEVLEILANKILSKSKLTEEQANELAEELKERVAKRHGLL